MRYMMFVMGFRRQYKPDMVSLQVLTLQVFLVPYYSFRLLQTTFVMDSFHHVLLNNSELTAARDLI